jgi:20S proteasome subunit beta 7
MNHLPQAWGRVSKARYLFHSRPLTDPQPRDDVYGAYDSSYLQSNGPSQRTQQPIVTGTSVIALKFKDGVVIAADNLGTSAPKKFNIKHS